MENIDLYTASLDEIVFEDRNKSYGGYSLRVLYERNLKRSAIIVFLTFTVLAAGIYYKMQQIEQVEEVTLLEVDMTALETKPIEPEQKELPPPPPPPKIEPPKVELVKFVPPVVKPDNLVTKEEPIKKDADLENVQTGTKNQDGEKSLNNLNMDDGEDDGIIGGTGQQERIYDFVSENPAFDGDPSGLAFKKFLQNRIVYPEAARQKGVTGSVYIQFVVTANGDVSNPKVVRGIPGSGLDDAALDAFKKKIPKFSPGKNNGVAVPVYQTVKIDFVLK
ncbi:MAG: energy transducer TonB [Cytophagaceae bacterium]